MSDPYRGPDTVTLQDDVQILREQLQKSEERLSRLQMMVLCILLPAILVVFPAIFGGASAHTENLHLRVSVLENDRNVHHAQIAGLAVETQHLWQAHSGKTARETFGELEWACIAWRSW